MAISRDEGAFEAVLEQVAQRREEFARERYVPRDIIDQFISVGIYRASTPARFGGEPLPPAEFLRKIERISAVDASAGWVASFGSALIYFAALPEATQAELYREGPDLVFSGGLFPVQPAESTAEGYRVSGQWKFASGCKSADWLGVGISGGAETNGKPLTALLRPSDVEIVENWHVLGLEGTGSHDLRVVDKVVPPEYTFIRGGTPTIDEPLYRYPTIAYAAQVLAVVGLGVGRAALDYAAETGSGRSSITGGPRLADKPYFRSDLAKAEAALRSARGFFYDITEEVWQTVLDGDPVPAKQAGLLRLAAVTAAKAGWAATQAAFTLSGTGAIADSHPMQRMLRDAAIPPQHAFLADGIYDSAGAVLTGLDPAPGFI
jgi:alkylation response protein AidB-like acyl-CoA dehydrogenase